jgi:Ca2+-binding EF-hand superfamily protein
METGRKLLIVLTIVLSAGVALGQDNHSGRRHRHGGNRSSANSSARGTDAQTAAFLRRVDTNHNGMIDEDEINQLGGTLKTIVEGKLTGLGIELKYPIPLSKIVVSPDGNRGRGSSGADGGESSAQDESSSDDSSAPPMNGFGASKPSLPTVPGFGQTSEQPSSSESKSDATSTPGPGATPSSHSASAKAGDASSATASAKSDSSSDSPKRTGPKSGRFLTPHERLSKELPDWFREKDVNGDGQVDMAEFASEWTPALIEEFNRYDLNHDGVITAAECLKVEGSRHKSK